MEKELKALKKYLIHSKLAVFAIVGFLFLITYLLITVSRQVGSDQSFNYQPKAFDMTDPVGPDTSCQSCKVESEKMRAVYPCVESIATGDYVTGDESIPKGCYCARHFAVTCKSDFVKIPYYLKNFCQTYGTPTINGVKCSFPDELCVEQDSLRQWMLAGELCGCPTSGSPRNIPTPQGYPQYTPTPTLGDPTPTLAEPTPTIEWITPMVTVN